MRAWSSAAAASRSHHRYTGGEQPGVDDPVGSPPLQHGVVDQAGEQRSAEQQDRERDRAAPLISSRQCRVLRLSQLIGGGQNC